MSVEDLGGWRQRVPEMTDEQVGEMLRLENNPWVRGSGHAVPTENAPTGNGPSEGGAAEGGSAGGYEFDPDTLAEIIRECEQLSDELRHDDYAYDLLAKVEPVAPDEYASQPFSRAIADFGQRQRDRNAEWARHLENFVATLRETRAGYARQEEQAAGDLGGAGKRDDG